MGCSPIGSDTKCLQHLHQKGFAIASSLSILETAISLFIQGGLYITHKKNSTLNSYSEGLSVAFQQSLCAQFIVLISFFTSLLTFHLLDSTHLIVGWLFLGGEAVHKPQHKNPFLYVINSTEMGKSN